MMILLLPMVMVVASLGYAETTDTAAGAVEISLLTTIVTGNIGLTLGLAIAIVGIFQFIKGKTAEAVTFVVLGVLITLLPGIYNGIRSISCTVVKGLDAHCGPQN